jgi:hypothetical protein
MKIKNIKDTIAGSVFFCIGLFFYIFSLEYADGSWLDFGPGVYPKIISSLLMISGTVLVVKSVR